MATPANWQQGEDVVIVPSLKDEEEIKQRFLKVILRWNLIYALRHSLSKIKAFNKALIEAQDKRSA